LHWEKDEFPMNSIIAGRTIDSIELPENTEASTRLRTEPEASANRRRDRQSRKHSRERTWTDAGMQIEFRTEQRAKTATAIFRSFDPDSNSKLDSARQSSKAPSEMMSTEDGMQMDLSA
jgi:hypothetical protein